MSGAFPRCPFIQEMGGEEATKEAIIYCKTKCLEHPRRNLPGDRCCTKYPGWDPEYQPEHQED